VTLTVGFDAHMLGTGETGNETYAWGMLQGLSELVERPEVVVYAGQPPVTAGFAYRHVSPHHDLRRLLLELPTHARRDGIRALHCTYSAPPRVSVPVVLTVHDVTFRTHPEWFSRRDLAVLTLGVAISIRRAAHVLALTEAARAEILRRYPVDPGRVTVTPIGPGPAAAPIPDTEAASRRAGLGLVPGRPYVLAVGARSPRKNIPTLVAAFARVVAEGFDGELVVVGARPGATAVAQPRWLRRIGPVGVRDLAALYQGAAALAIPSLDEGFGLAALEALAHGLPVAASDIGALREVCGDDATYFDPRRPAGMAGAIQDAVRRGPSPRYRERAGQFTWRRAAEQTVEVYRRVAGSA
jgi:glycosyltransferase involved in cell wall biosynthesis